MTGRHHQGTQLVRGLLGALCLGRSGRPDLRTLDQGQDPYIAVETYLKKITSKEEEVEKERPQSESRARGKGTVVRSESRIKIDSKGTKGSSSCAIQRDEK